VSGLLLSIETSHDTGGVAIADGRTPPVEELSTQRLKHSEELLVLIDRLLKGLGVSMSDLDGIAVSIGPGSFTGLRVGLAAAKGLCLSGGLPLVSVGTLDVFARMCPEGGLPIFALIDAKRGELYWCSYEYGGGKLKRTGEYLAISPGKLVELIAEKTLVVGSGVEAYMEYIKENAGDKVKFLDPNPEHPLPGVVATVGLEKLNRGEVEDIGEIEPIYIRPSDAETTRRDD
jgi:tRNA threonylcarbamoyladenosine biosynthesis protein TsaB